MTVANRDGRFEAMRPDVHAAIEILDHWGLVILRGAVPVQIAEALHRRILEEERFVLATDQETYDYTRMSQLASPGHCGFLPALSGPFIDCAVLMPPMVEDLLTRYLGQDFFLHEWVVNVNKGGNLLQQNLHRDEDPDTQGRRVGAILHVATQDLGPWNGMTQFHPASHRAGFHPDSAEDAAFQPMLAVGDVVVRDLGLLHRGVANPAPDPRYLTALVFNPGWHEMDPRFVRPIGESEHRVLGPLARRILRTHRMTTAVDEVRSIAYPRPAEE